MENMYVCIAHVAQIEEWPLEKFHKHWHKERKYGGGKQRDDGRQKVCRK